MGVLALSLSGCTGIVESLQYDSRLLVKVPGSSYREVARAGPWNFRHVVDVPTDGKVPSGQWYVAWRSDDAVVGLSMPWSTLATCVSSRTQTRRCH